MKSLINLIRKYQKQTSGMLLILLVSAFVLFKIPHLELPFFWDEAYPYSYAIFEMYNNGLSLSPDALPAELSKGHPLLFHFLSASWMKLFGTGLVALNAFPLLISTLVLFVCWKTGTEFFGPAAGILAATLSVSQAVFLAQSTFLLPEMLLTLFILLSFYFYLKKKNIWFMVFATFALYTKETAIVSLFAVFLLELIRLTKGKSTIRQFLMKTPVMIAPLLAVGIFFLLQKSIRGWYFYPLHLDLMEFNPENFLSQLEAYAAYLFIYYGRNAITFTLLLALIIGITGKRLKPDRPVLLFLLFIAGFILFSALNFFSPRYLLCCIPPFALLVSDIVIKAFGKIPIMTALSIPVMTFTPLYFSFNHKTGKDHNLGYVDAVRVNEEAIDYCLERKWNDKRIHTGFLMYKYMSSPHPGYVQSNEVFTSVSNKGFKKAEVFILTSMENEEDEELVKKGGKYKKAFGTQHGNNVAQIYVKK